MSYKHYSSSSGSRSGREEGRSSSRREDKYYSSSSSSSSRDRSDKYSQAPRQRESDSYRERSRDDRTRSHTNTETVHSHKRKREVSPPAATSTRAKKRSNLWDQLPDTTSIVNANPNTQFSAIPSKPVTGHIQDKRLYVGNLPPSVLEEELSTFFTNQFIQAKLTTSDIPPIQSVQITREKNYAFLECSTPELASSGLLLDGISFQNQILKIRRPRDYQGFDSMPQQNFQPLSGIVSTNVADSPNKLFIGGLPASMDDDQVKELINFFGELKSFHLVKDNQTSLSKGYAFFEYLDPRVIDRACRALNNKNFGGKTLIVQRAELGAKNKIETMYDYSSISSTVSSLMNLKVNVASVLHSNNLQTTVSPTNILVLINMVSFIDLIDSDEVNELKKEIEEECCRFGEVLSVVIPSCNNETEIENIKGVGKVFVQFQTVEQAVNAQKALALRKFDRRCVLTSYLDENLFLNGLYDGSEDIASSIAIEKLEKQFTNQQY